MCLLLPSLSSSVLTTLYPANFLSWLFTLLDGISSVSFPSFSYYYKLSIRANCWCGSCCCWCSILIYVYSSKNSGAFPVEMIFLVVNVTVPSLATSIYPPSTVFSASIFNCAGTSSSINFYGLPGCECWFTSLKLDL